MDSNVDSSMVNVSDGQRVPSMVSGVTTDVVAGQNIRLFIHGEGSDGLSVPGSSDVVHGPSSVGGSGGSGPGGVPLVFVAPSTPKCSGDAEE
ncbi:hypothetical protein LIER_42079 [Lithospermum erythrorhizon]|uniref:Uncharacterized protein n=1 Tax=Lithospermum erythrorhizon TaxID=34254 RepID=A0AAV3RJN1_LITER